MRKIIKIYSPALLIVVIGSVVFFQRREVLMSANEYTETKMTGSSETKRTSLRNVAYEQMRRFEDLLNTPTPQMRRTWRDSDAELEIAFSALEQNWTAQEESSVRLRVKPAILAQLEARSQQGLSEQDFVTQLDHANQTLDHAMKQALGEELFSEWQRAKKRARARAVEEQVNHSLHVLDEVLHLSEAQKNELHAAFTRQLTKPQTKPLDDRIVLRTSYESGVLPKLTNELELAREILNPQQMIQHDLAQEARTKANKAVLAILKPLISQLSQ